MKRNNIGLLKLRIILWIIAVWRRRWLIAIPVFLLPLAGFAVSKIAPTTYKSHTSMLIQETSKMNPFLEDIAVSTMLNDRLNALQTLLKSRHILSAVAKDLEHTTAQTSEYQRDQVIAKLASKIRVSQISKDFLKIEYQDSKPDDMKAVLESVSKHFVDHLLAPERSSISDSSQFLSTHIEEQRIALQAAEQALADYTNEHSSLTPELQSQSYARIAAMQQNLAEKQAELSGVERSLGSLDQQLSQTNPVIGRIEEQIIETRSELTLLQAKYTDTHSAVQAKKRALSRLESERETLIKSERKVMNSDQLWDLASSKSISSDKSSPLLVSQLHSLQKERGRYLALQEETERLKSMISELEERTRGFGDKVKQIYRLQRDVELKRDLYENLLQRYDMAQLTGSLGRFEESKRVKVIDQPYTPTSPSNLPSIVFIIAGIIGGIGLGIGLTIIAELFDGTIRSSQDIREATDVPVIVALPKFVEAL